MNPLNRNYVYDLTESSFGFDQILKSKILPLIIHLTKCQLDIFIVHTTKSTISIINYIDAKRWSKIIYFSYDGFNNTVFGTFYVLISPDIIRKIFGKLLHSMYT